MRPIHYYKAALLALIIIVLTFAIGYWVSERNNESKIAELKTELKQAKAKIKVTHNGIGKVQILAWVLD